MLCILRPDGWYPDRHVAVTVVNGPTANDWPTAQRRGYFHTPPAPVLTPIAPAAVRLLDVLRDVRARRRQGVRPRSLLAHVRDVRVERLRDARAQRETVARANRQTLQACEDARARARPRHAHRIAGKPAAAPTDNR